MRGQDHGDWGSTFAMQLPHTHTRSEQETVRERARMVVEAHPRGLAILTSRAVLAASTAGLAGSVLGAMVVLLVRIDTVASIKKISARSTKKIKEGPKMVTEQG